MDESKKILLKRTDYMSAVDSNKIWSKKMTIPEIKTTLEKLESFIKNYIFLVDNYFIMTNRRSALLKMINEKLENKNGNANEILCDVLFNFWEIVSNDYPGNLSITAQQIGAPVEEIQKRDKIYREDGIICANEMALLTLIIRNIKRYINEVDN